MLSNKKIEVIFIKSLMLLTLLVVIMNQKISAQSLLAVSNGITETGTRLVSSNVLLEYAFNDGGNSISYDENEVTGTSISNIVGSIFGFLTTTTLNINNTNILTRGSSAYYQYTFFNNGNDNIDFNFTSADLVGSARSALINVSLVDDDDRSDNLISLASVNSGGSVDVFLKVAIPGDFAVDANDANNQFSFQISNGLSNSQALLAVNYTNSLNNLEYGGLAAFSDAVNILVSDESQLSLSKTNIISNTIDDVARTPGALAIPGDQIVYTINYSNTSSTGVASNIVISDFIHHNNFVDYLKNSLTATEGSAVLSYSLAGDSAFVTTEPAANPTGSSVVSNLDAVRVSISSIPANGNGSFSYIVVIR